MPDTSLDKTSDGLYDLMLEALFRGDREQVLFLQV